MFCVRSHKVSLAALSSDFIPRSASPDTQVHMLTCSIVVQMLGWLLKRLSLLIGACRGITAEGEHHPTNLDVENHICALPNKFIYRELNILGETFPATPHLLPWISSVFFHFFIHRSSKTERAGGVGVKKKEKK